MQLNDKKLLDAVKEEVHQEWSRNHVEEVAEAICKKLKPMVLKAFLADEEVMDVLLTRVVKETQTYILEGIKEDGLESILDNKYIREVEKKVGEVVADVLLGEE